MLPETIISPNRVSKKNWNRIPAAKAGEHPPKFKQRARQVISGLNLAHSLRSISLVNLQLI